ncbi:MAG: T9SS type A sorting domain-containing protein [Lentimicrobium sp.]|nr:T9SS type A sorting domain-containing protein [Lentimicrobium sp.]
MKKLLLIATAVCISAGLFAQKSPVKVKSNVPTASMKLYNVDEESLLNSTTIVNNTLPRPSVKGTADITIVDLGGSANSYGLYNGGRTAIWADPNINAVAFFHRMLIPPGSGYVAHDLSLDGGNTWTVNNQFYNPTVAPGANARYPQGVLVNPVGNTDPNNAYAVNVNPILDGSNGTAGSWGGLGAAFTKLDGTGAAQQSWPSTPPFRNNVPDAMTVNPVTGEVFVVEPSLIGGLGNQYVDTLVITRGNIAGDAITWEQELLYAPVVSYGTSVADTRIAFAPDGQTGYIMTLSDNGVDGFATGLAYYPILYKTTDGGNTWSDAITVPLGGPDGMNGIVNGLLTDDQIAELFEEPLPARDEIAYTTAFTSDFAVDYNGNPVISVVIGVAASDPYSIVSAAGFFASYNILSLDGGQTWLAQKLGANLKTFRGEWGEVAEDNRSQLTTSYDGRYMFFSWLDTDFEGQTDNIQPDIFCVGWDVENNLYTDVVNVTFLSDAWLQAYMGTASYYALPAADGHIVPLMYQDFNTTDPLQPVQYKYIKDFSFSAADYYIVGNSYKETVSRISQNYPNPFNGVTRVDVSLTKQANVSLEVYNLLGQKVYEIPARNLGEGTHNFQINAAGLNAGIYTYSVIANGERTTRKMVIK